MRQLVLTTVLATLASRAPAQAPPTREEALAALRKCVGFYVDQVGATGPYVWRYSGDLAIREGEGKATATIGWVQPPGMPASGVILSQTFIDNVELLCTYVRALPQR